MIARHCEGISEFLPPMLVSAGGICYTISCEELRLSIQFTMNCGEFGRIGSSADMEISLPLVGLSEEECRLHLDETGELWLLRGGEVHPVRIDTPAYFRCGPYRFLIRENLDQLVVTSPAPTTQLDPELEETVSLRRDLSFRLSKAVMIAGCIGVLAVVGSAVWFANRNSVGDAEIVKDSQESQTSVVEAKSPNLEKVALDASEEDIGKQSKLVENPISSEQPVADRLALESSSEKPQMDLEKLASMVAPCVFLIEVKDAAGNLVATGTGFAVSADGLVATNYHVIENGKAFSLVTAQGAKFDRVRIVAANPEADLAIIRIDAKGLPFLTLAATSNVPVGKRVAVYGSPVGLSGTLSEGIISASPRNLSENRQDELIPNHGVLLQTTAPVSSGSSGSPLFDAEGKVIGVITMMMQGPDNPQNLNFAVPVEALRPLIMRASSGGAAVESIVEAPRPVGSTASSGPNSGFFADPASRQLQEQINSADWVKSLKIARELSERYPKSPLAHFQHAYCAAMLRLDHQAEISFMKVIELQPTNHLAWNNLGLVFGRQENPQKALAAFERAVALKPDHFETWDSIVVTSVVLENWSKAATALETLAQLNPGRAKERAKMLSSFRFPDAGISQAVRNALLIKSGDAVANEGILRFRVMGLSLGDLLSVRSGPGVSYDKVTSISNGAEVFVVGPGKMNGDTEWLPIEYGNMSGWVVSRFLEVIE